jgi:hypothetical protein
METESNLHNIKLDIIQWLLTLEDTEVIEKIKEIQTASTKDWWNTISGDEQESIVQGLKDANNGKLKPHSQARNIYEQWL